MPGALDGWLDGAAGAALTQNRPEEECNANGEINLLIVKLLCNNGTLHCAQQDAAPAQCTNKQYSCILQINNGKDVLTFLTLVSC